MKNNIMALVAGVLFAFGMGLTGMTNPAKITGFLDIFGNWDPTMMFAVGGAVSTYLMAWLFIRRRSAPLLDKQFFIPDTQINKSLILGAVIFGVGWGLSGYCPGPAIVSVASGILPVVIYLIAMLVGMYSFRIYKLLTEK